MTQGNGATEIKQSDLANGDKLDIILEVLAQLQEQIAELDERISNLSARDFLDIDEE